MRTDLPYKPKRREIIGLSYEQFRAIRKIWDQRPVPKSVERLPARAMGELWKLYDRIEIVQKLDVLCPGHGFTKTSHKIPMLVKWVQHQAKRDDPEFIRRCRSIPEQKEAWRLPW